MQRNDQGMLMQALMSMQGEREPMDQSGTYTAKAADEGALDAWKTVVGAREGRARMANERGAGREQLANALQRAQMQAEAERARQALMAQMNTQKLAQEREMQGLLFKHNERNDGFNQTIEQGKLDAMREKNRLDAEAKKAHYAAMQARAAQPRGPGRSGKSNIRMDIDQLGLMVGRFKTAAATWSQTPEGQTMAAQNNALAQAAAQAQSELQDIAIDLDPNDPDPELLKRYHTVFKRRAALESQAASLPQPPGQAGVAQQKQGWSEDGPPP